MTTPKIGILALFILTLFLSFANAAEGQAINDSIKNTTTKNPLRIFDALTEREGFKWNIIPGPLYDPSTSFGLFIAPMLTFYPTDGDTISPASTASFVGLVTTNLSYLFGMGSQLYIQEDTWRFKFEALAGGLNKNLTLLDTYPGTTITIPNTEVEARSQQRVITVDAHAMHKVFENTYLGGGYTYRKQSFVGRDDNADTLVIANGLRNPYGNHGISYKIDWDTRDNIQYPYSGYFLSYTGYNFFESQNQENAYYDNNIKALGFWSLTDNHRHILAAKYFGKILTGNASAANYSYYGRVAKTIQRGYESGRRVDKNAMNLEVEYRWTTKLIDDRIRFMALLGTGKVYGDYHNFNTAEWLPVTGIGARYAILPYERINLRTDLVYGKDGFFWYFAVREAF